MKTDLWPPLFHCGAITGSCHCPRACTPLQSPAPKDQLVFLPPRCQQGQNSFQALSCPSMCTLS